MAKEAYLALLRDPRWQETRLRIMDRDGFMCRWCGDRSTTLSVHHTYYRKGAQPWEYPHETLVTMCEACHEKAEPIRLRMQEVVGAATVCGLFGEIEAFVKTRLAIAEHRSVVVRVVSDSEAFGVAAGMSGDVNMDEVLALAKANGGEVHPLEIHEAAWAKYNRDFASAEDHYDGTLS